MKNVSHPICMLTNLGVKLNTFYMFSKCRVGKAEENQIWIHWLQNMQKKKKKFCLQETFPWITSKMVKIAHDPNINLNYKTLARHFEH